MASLYSQGSARPAKPRLTPLPTYTQEKTYLTSPPSGWTTTVYIPIPRAPGRRCKLILPIPPRLWQSTIGFGRRRPRIMTLVVLLFLWLLVSTWRRLGMHQRQWKVPGMGDPPTLVFAREDLQKVWQWEIASGHYPSKRLIPTEIGLTDPPLNPGLPRRKHANAGSDTLPPRFRAPVKQAFARSDSIGVGAKRTYLDIQSKPPTTSYPPRPYPGSIADLDTIMDLCSFPDNYVRDCLEVLRLGGGLDNDMRVRRGEMDEWKYIYIEDPVNDTVPAKPSRPKAQVPLNTEDPNAGLTFKWRSELEPHLKLPEPLTPRFPTGEANADPCDPDHQRIYHMYWTGPFTDKPYLALMSYLFTQNLGLHLPAGTPPKGVCRPQFWMWINPATAAAELGPTALIDMFDQLAASPWAAPFLHPRFKDVIKFKLWNTTEQLDGVPELKNDWRAVKENLFNSGGYVYAVPQAKDEAKSSTTTTEEEENSSSKDGHVAYDSDTTTAASPKKEDDLFDRVGSTSQNSYDRLSVVLSDMARFVLCHRFGGTYLDADTILLRDWEELWGWKGAFAYRWSRLEKYNTAVLRLNKGSALGSFLFRTALRNGLDFHPMTVSRYTKEAYLEGLLLRLPDALFDSAWLNTEYYQRDRPPFPYFQAFEDFFNTRTQDSAGPQALGFDGFFKGAYSYHFHNFWWEPFDRSRNFPDLGERFIANERKARLKLLLAAAATASNSTGTVRLPDEKSIKWEDHVSEDQRDLGWATVLKRTFESYIRGERPNMYGEWLDWS